MLDHFRFARTHEVKAGKGAALVGILKTKNRP